MINNWLAWWCRIRYISCTSYVDKVTSRYLPMTFSHLFTTALLILSSNIPPTTKASSELLIFASDGKIDSSGQIDSHHCIEVILVIFLIRCTAQLLADCRQIVILKWVCVPSVIGFSVCSHFCIFLASLCKLQSQTHIFITITAMSWLHILQTIWAQSQSSDMAAENGIIFFFGESPITNICARL